MKTNLPFCSTEILQKIYDSEINMKIHWFWDSGIEWEVGDLMSGYPARPKEILELIRKIDMRNVNRAIEVMAYEVYLMYPDSEFGKWYSKL